MPKLLFAALLLSASVSAKAELLITVIDSQTGRWLAADVVLEPIQAGKSHWHARIDGRASPELPPGRYRISAQADGYRSLSSEIEISGRQTRPVWLELNRTQSAITAPKTNSPGGVSGYLTRAEDGQPLAGARVFFGHDQSMSVSDQNGFFHLTATETTDSPTLHVISEDRSLQVTFSKRSLQGQKIRQALAPGHWNTRIAQPTAWRPNPPTHWPDRNAGQPFKNTTSAESGLPVLQTNPSIRVGDDCIGRLCNEVRIMTLEDYVAGGLPNEWIASWHLNSLRAGAVAYRSYGAWHTANPIDPGYDICNSTSCQVWNAQRHQRTDQAVADTSGIVLKLPNQDHAFRAEYAAENNNLLGDRECSNVDLSCGDGFVGSPSTDWPCLDDSPVATGQSCFGHGRGMSQWGTQGWALLGSSWPWIVNHYYNDSGNGEGLRQAGMTRPFQTGALELSTTTLGNGSRLGVTWATQMDDENQALTALFGASLRCDGNWIDDSANDAQVSIDPGNSQLQREFRLNQTLAAGLCDVMVAVYADGNDSASIDSDDQLLVRLIQTDVITIDPDQLFRDDFQR